LNNVTFWYIILSMSVYGSLGYLPMLGYAYKSKIIFIELPYLYNTEVIIINIQYSIYATYSIFLLIMLIQILERFIFNTELL